MPVVVHGRGVRPEDGGEPVEGPELIVNGTFSDGQTGWTTEQLADGWGPKDGYFGLETALFIPDKGGV